MQYTKFTPPYLFAITSVLSLVLGIFSENQTMNIQFHTSLFVVGFLPIYLIFGFFCVLITIFYLGLQKIGKFVNNRTGYWHFDLFIVGLALLVISANLEKPYKNLDFYVYSGYSFVGALSALLISFLIFVFGVIKAIMK